MKALRMAAACALTMALLAMAVEVHAASARVRCEVELDRLKIQVDGMDVAAGTYFAKLKNRTSGARARTERGKEQAQPLPVGDVDLDFDSTAGPNDADSFIRLDFAQVGDRVKARVVRRDPRGVVARASTVCVQK